MHKTECVSPNDRIGDLRAMLQMLAAGVRWEKVCYRTYYLLEILGANDHEKTMKHQKPDNFEARTKSFGGCQRWSLDVSASIRP